HLHRPLREIRSCPWLPYTLALVSSYTHPNAATLCCTAWSGRLTHSQKRSAKQTWSSGSSFLFLFLSIELVCKLLEEQQIGVVIKTFQLHLHSLCPRLHILCQRNLGQRSALGSRKHVPPRLPLAVPEDESLHIVGVHHLRDDLAVDNGLF